MDDVPIFSGERKELDSWVTCGQFISAIETFAYNCNFMEVEMKDFCLTKLSESAREFFLKNFNKSWNELKKLMFQKFPVKLTIREKVEIRKGLQQSDTESIDDFYRRCLQAQYFVSDDDVRDVGFEREVLLHFLIGLSPLIRDLVLATKCSSTVDFINEAKKYVQVVKEEPPEVNIKVELDPYYEEYDYNSQYESYGNYFPSEAVSVELENEEPITKTIYTGNVGRPKTERSDDLERRTCKECNKVFVNHKGRNRHIKLIHLQQTIKPDIKPKIELDGDQKKTFTCHLCEKTFSTKQNMKIHIMNVHSPSKGIMCIDCGKTFKNEMSLNEHQKRLHSGAANKWRCGKCGGTFNIKDKEKHCKLLHKQCNNCDKLYVNRLKHYQRWHGKSDLCWYCDFKGNENEPLELHMNENHVDHLSQFNKFTCDLCGKAFKTNENLNLHIDNVHSPAEGILCINCGKTFKNEMSLKEHVKRVHSGGATHNWKCEICDETIKSKEHLLDHQDKVHGHLKQNCEICNEVFLSIKSLSVHIAQKHCPKDPEKGYVCLYCNLVTKKSASKLGYHIMNKHFNQPLYQCNQCGKGFDEKNCLVSHIKHNHTTEKLFQCDKCAKNFKTVGLLNSHVKGMHEEQENATCKECNKVFKNSKSLRDHFRNMHSGADRIRTKYVCDDCGKSFLQKNNFQNHALIHLSEEEKEKLKINCQFPGCDYSTLIKENLDNHFKRVHEKVQNYQCAFCAKGFFSKGAMVEHTNGVHLNLKPLQCDLCGFASAYRSTLQEHKKVAHGTQGRWKQRSDTKVPRF